jgi:serine phosphatase RsbU (regulator of sigma subunit)
MQNNSLQEKYNRLSLFAKKFWPDIDSLSDQRRLIGTGDVLTFLYTLPFATIGIVWLIFETDFDLIINQSVVLLFNLALMFLFTRLSFFLIVEIRSDRYGSSQDSFASMVQWSTAFILGPTALWLSVVQYVSTLVRNWREATNPSSKWILLRNLSVSLVVNVLAILISLEIYVFIGGSIPLSNLHVSTVSRALSAQVIQLILVFIFLSGYLLYHIGVQRILAGSQSVWPLVRFYLVGTGLPFLANPFAILLAGLYSEHGPVIYTFLMAGLLIVAFLTRRLSMVAENSRQQSRQLEKLEQLGRDLLEVIPNPSSLPQLLEKHIPGMFPSGRVSIWISPNTSLLNFPVDWPDVKEDTWQWIMTQSEPRSFLVKEELPWNTGIGNHRATVTVPIIRSDSGRSIGGILLELRALAQPWDRKSLRNLFPALQALADQIASSLNQAQVYQDSLEYQQISQELQLAGQIQASFLPNKFPPIPGWQLAVTLSPARETSGDFFDVFELSDGRLGIIVADVADKGVGSALYMALSRTLLRTYAEEYDADPDVVFFAANNRLLKDARANLFITIFYGILDPDNGTITYCNAGHIPPYLIRSVDQDAVNSLARTGMPMGIEADATWNIATVHFEPGDILIIYTDGIPDAQDDAGNFFNDETILTIARENAGRLAFEIQSAIIDEVQRFSGNSPQTDDITLMVLVRDK